MSGVILEPFTSIEAAERNFSRLNEAVVALQGGSIAIENIEGFENLATMTDLTDGMDEVRAECQYSVGDVHISESEIDPKDKLGYGEWLLISQGRCLVGIDDAEPGDQNFQTPGQTGGEKQVTLTIAQMPAHTHDMLITSGGGLSVNPPMMGASGVGRPVSGNSCMRSAGGGQSHNNLQPYYCVYIWRRTA